MNWNYDEHSKTYVINDAEFPFPPNFAGEERQFNDAGKRNFVVKIDKDLYDELKDAGVRVRTYVPKNPDYDDGPIYLLTVKVYIPEPGRNSGRAPEVWMRNTEGRMRPLEGDMCSEIDIAWGRRRIEEIDLEFHVGSSRKYPSNPPCAYLDSIVVSLKESPLMRRFQSEIAEAEMEEALPF